MGVKDYDLNPDNNTQINGINIAEGCPPSGINNAIRQLMADVKEDSDAQSEALKIFSETPASAENLGPVKVGDGLTMGEDGTLSANLATAEAAGRVKASTTAQAGVVPLGGADGTLGEDWLKKAMEAAAEAKQAADAAGGNNVKAYLVDAWKSKDGSAWYRKYSDGWIEQGGNTSLINAPTVKTITLNTPFSTNSYAVVVNFGLNATFSPTYQAVCAFNRTKNSFDTLLSDNDVDHCWYACGY